MEFISSMLSTDVFEIVIRLFEAILISGIIGIDREKARRPAGLRTHVILTLGACLVTVGPILYPIGNTDPLRMAAQVLSGIGFLGAGTILRFKENVVGLTTAASLWTSACLGICAGMGAHAVAIIGGLSVIGTLKLVPYIERKYLKKYAEFQVSITIEEGKKELAKFSELVKRLNIIIKSVNIDIDPQGNKVYDFSLAAPSDEEKTNFMNQLYLLDIHSVKEEKDEYDEN